MAGGYKWLEGIATGMRDAIANGAAPTPERITIRELIGKFGYLKRGDYINSRIRNGLERFNLITDKDIAIGWIDSSITIQLELDEPDVREPEFPSDPTHRIGSLEAANRTPMSVSPDSPLNAATTIMQLHDYSQLPVMNGERDVAGVISWKSIGARLALGRRCEIVRQCMDSACELSATVPLFDSIAIIAEHGYVLVRGGDNRIAGIVTSSDLSFQFMQLAGPFLFVGEIEGHLRHLIHGRFTLEELRTASISEEGRSIEGSGDLTIGGYCRLLENKENWEKLKLNIDRSEFVKHLEAVRQIRNNVMHFNPDGPSEDESRTLRDIARFFENLARIGIM